MENKVARIQEIYRRGLQDKLPPEKRQVADELIRRGVVKIDGQPVQPQKQPTSRFDPAFRKEGQKLVEEQRKTIGAKVLNSLQKTGTGIIQLSNELGSRAFTDTIRNIATMVAPEFKEEIQGFTPDEITDIVTKASKEKVAERETQVSERTKGLGTVAELATDIATFAPTGAISGAGALAGTRPVEVGEGLAERGVETAKGVGIAIGTLGVLKGTGGALKMANNAVRSGISKIKTGAGAKTVEELGETTLKLKEEASSLYKQMREANASLNKRASKGISKALSETLEESGKLNKDLHKNTLSVMRDLKKATQSGEVGLEELDQYRQLLNEVVRDSTDVFGTKADGQKAIMLIRKLDDIVENLKPQDLTEGGKGAVNLLTEARKNWKVFKKHQKIANLIDKADGDPSKIRTAVQRFVTNKKNLLGFTAQEQQALRNAGKLTSGEEILKGLGRFGVEPKNVFLPLLGGAVINPALPIVGTVARKAQKLMSVGKIDDALSLIAKSGADDIAKTIKTIPTKEGQKLMLDKILAISATKTGEE